MLFEPLDLIIKFLKGIRPNSMGHTYSFNDRIFRTTSSTDKNLN